VRLRCHSYCNRHAECNYVVTICALYIVSETFKQNSKQLKSIVFKENGFNKRITRSSKRFKFCGCGVEADKKFQPAQDSSMHCER